MAIVHSEKAQDSSGCAKLDVSIRHLSSILHPILGNPNPCTEPITPRRKKNHHVSNYAISARRLALPFVIGALALGLSACSATPTAPVRDTSTGEITEANDTADVFLLAVGDCTNDEGTTSGEINTVATVPCSDPHDNEAYLSVDLPDGEFPGDEAVGTQADQICYDGFAEFVGASYDASTLDYFPITPTEGSWGSGDREVLCLVFDGAMEKLTGTMQGSAR